MPNKRLWRRAQALGFACCVLAGMSVTGRQTDNASQKTSGSLSAILRATPSPAPTITSTTTTSQTGDQPGDVSTARKQKEMSPLRYTFRTRAGVTFPSDFGRFVPDEAQSSAAGVGTQLFSVAATSEEPLRAGVDAQEVISIEIERPQEPGPIMDVSPRNLGARKSHFVEEFNGEFPGINGENVRAAVMDGGGVLGTHVEFRLNPLSASQSRVEVNTGAGARDHATHVAGTLAAAGRAPDAKGMAPALRLVSDDWWDDLRKLEALAPNIQISNHSYGPLAGWSRDEFDRWRWWGDRQISADEDSKFGKYTSREAQLDAVLFGFPHLVTFIAAGNDRDDGPPAERQPVRHMVLDGLEWVESSEVHRVDGFDRGGLDTIIGLGLAKNAICIGAVDDITSTSGTRMVSYSGWGPADDGRVKPDLIANGHHLLSTSNAGDEEYVDMSGTSMASPTAAGIAALLVQLYQRERGAAPTAAAIKAILIHTARDAGEPGPDPVFGWGSIDALRAGRLIARRLDPQNFLHVMRTGEYVGGQPNDPPHDLPMTLSGTGDPIKVTLVWTDPSGAENLRGLDDATPALINDLDVKLIAPDGQVFHPYSLDRNDPTGPARRDRENHVDNVEVIEGAVPMTGTWTVRVTASRLGAGPRQSYALIVSGLKPL